MTIDNVQDITPRVQYIATGGQTVFPYPFPIFENSDIVAAVNGATITTYSVSGAGNDTGGNVTLSTGATAGDIVTIYRDIPIARSTNYQQNGPFTAAAINAELDRIVAIEQQLAASIDFSLSVPITEAVSPASLVLSPAAYANKLLGFDSNGNPTPAVSTNTVITGPIVGGLLFPQTGEEQAAAVVPSAPAYDRPYIERQGAVAGLAVDALAAVNKAISVNNRRIRSYDGDFLMSGGPTNPNGIEFEGTGNLLQVDPNGGYHQLNSYGDRYKVWIGQEYLYRVYQRMKVSSTIPITAFAYGDSTIQGSNASAPFLVQNLLPRLVKNKGIRIGMSLTNRGVSGTEVSSLNAIPDLSTTTDLIFIKYGINDGQEPLSTRLATFTTTLRAKLAAIRAATNGNYNSVSIVLLGPNTTNDSPTGRDERWYEQLRGVYVQAARDFQCAYFDTYAYILDSRHAYSYWMEATTAPNIAIHPDDMMYSWIWGAVIDNMFGQSASDAWRGNFLTNTTGNLDVPLSTDLPAAYPFGISIRRATSGQGWPEDGMVVTVQQLDAIAVQFLIPFANGRTLKMTRTASSSGGGWNLWSGQVVALAPANSWVTFGGAFDTPKAVLGDDGIVNVSMCIKSGTTTIGTTITTLPAGMRPAASVGPIPCTTNAGTMCQVTVASDGTIKFQSAGDATYTGINFSFRAA